MKKALVLVLLSLIWGQMSFAGIKEGGGGVGFLCHENGKDRVYLADTYELVKDGKLKGKESLDMGIIFLAAGQRFSEANVQDLHFKDFLSGGWALIFRSSHLGWQVDHNLPLLGDDHISFGEIPANCEKVQLAIQDLRTGIVSWNNDLVSKMTPAETGFFVLHETLIALRNDPGADTSPIRAAVSSVLDSQKFSKFVEGIIDPNTLLPIQTDLKQYEQVIADLPGQYVGKDQLNKDCSVSITREGNNLNFTQQVFSADGSTWGKLNIRSIPIAGLVQKLAYDTNYIKQQKAYSASWLNVNYYSYRGVPSLFGTYPMDNTVALGWYKGPLETVNLTMDFSNGPYRDVNKSSGLYCHSLKSL
jgi:hypothetical protein